jgi:hypothetical protein
LKSFKSFLLSSRKSRNAFRFFCWLKKVITFMLDWILQNMASSWDNYSRSDEKIVEYRKFMLIIFWNTKGINVINNFPDHTVFDRVHFINYVLILIRNFLMLIWQ